jgi:hypothetical protein
MSRELCTPRFRRERTLRERGPLAEAFFTARRYMSRMSWTDAGALLLVWGNIIGLIAYPVLAGSDTSAKEHRQAAAVSTAPVETNTR